MRKKRSRRNAPLLHQLGQIATGGADQAEVRRARDACRRRGNARRRDRARGGAPTCTVVRHLGDLVEEQGAVVGRSDLPVGAVARRSGEVELGAWPNSSLSSTPLASAPQLSATNGPLARELAAWMARAKSSLPVPVSASSSTGRSVAAKRVAASFAATSTGVGRRTPAQRPRAMTRLCTRWSRGRRRTAVATPRRSSCAPAHRRDHARLLCRASSRCTRMAKVRPPAPATGVELHPQLRRRHLEAQIARALRSPDGAARAKPRPKRRSQERRRRVAHARAPRARCR